MDEQDIDMTPICWACGEPMEWTSEYRELVFDAGCFVVQQPIYECCNPDCYEDDEDDWLDDHYTCSCPYCHCTNTVIGGAKCSDCLEGAHQG